MFLRARALWEAAEAEQYGEEYIAIGVGGVFMAEQWDQQGWTLGTRLQDHAKGWFPAEYVEEINRLDINPSFIVDIHFHLACAVGDNQNLMLQLVLPPEYYTLEGQPIVCWKWLALPDGVIFRGAWDAWKRTRVHMTLDAHDVSQWDDATMFAFCVVFAEKWKAVHQASVEFQLENRFHRYWWITREPILHGSPQFRTLEPQKHRRRESFSALLGTGLFTDRICQLLGVLAMTLLDVRYKWPVLHLQSIRHLHFTSDLPSDLHLHVL